jgi:stage II sporulation protein E
MNVELIGFKIFSDYFYNYKVVLEVKGNKNVIDCVIDMISSNLGVKLYTEYKYHNKVLDSYYFILKNDEKIKFNLSIKQRSKESGVCGDSYLVFNTKNKKYLLISDGMGHGKKASKESGQALLLLKDFIELGMSPKEAIIICNSLLYEKNKESFNTLDLFEYDSYEDKMSLYKNGSGLTYIKDKKRVERISSKNLPLGIVEEINVEKKSLSTDVDYIVLTSDGLKKDLSKVIFTAKRKNAKGLSEEILKYEGNNIEDDQTIVVISVIKKA